MNVTLLVSAFLLGSAGSLHCAGMCGPLCLLLPINRAARTKRLLLLTFYQLGRVCSYGLIGLLIGLAGRGLYKPAYQQWFSVSLGVLMLLMALLYFYQNSSIESGFVKKYYQSVRRLIIATVKKAHSWHGSLLFGMANGLLPCGMVYMATLGALGTSGLLESTLFMVLFGLGTVPLMFMIGYAGHSSRWRRRVPVKKLVPAFIMLTACILILRGLNLGIPFISPHFSEGVASTVACHP
jgi:sulfite exporter TauE/SafE